MKTQTLGSATRRALFAAAFCAAALPSLAEDWTVSGNTTLTEDKSVDKLTVNSGVTLDLNGYKLYCTSLAGSGTIISSNSSDLTIPSGTVTWSVAEGSGTVNGSGENLFNNVIPTSATSQNDERIMVAKAKLPLVVTYDFGEGTPATVNEYNVHFSRAGVGYNARGPKTWTLEGSNDNSSWTGLDSKDNVSWSSGGIKKTFAFTNNTAYRYYRITFTASSDGSYLELNQLEYFNTNPGELHVNTASGETVTVPSTLMISGNVQVMKEGSGTLGGITQIASVAGSTVALEIDGGKVAVDNATLTVGYNGNGTLTINGGTVDVSSPDQNVNLAQNSGSSGTINLNAGGTLKTRRIVRVNGSSGALNFNGGTLQANPTSNTGLSGGLIASSVTVTANENGGTIDSGNLAITVGAAIGGTGAMRFKGGNTITLSGASTYEGVTTIELGTKIITSNETAKNTILGGLVIDGKSKLTDATGIEVFQYGSALTDPDDLGYVSLVNCGAGSAARIDGNKIVVDFVAPAWELSDNAYWSDLVTTYGAPSAGAAVIITASAKYTLTIDTDVTVAQISFTGTNPNVVVNSGCTVTADTVNFSAANTARESLPLTSTTIRVASIMSTTDASMCLA